MGAMDAQCPQIPVAAFADAKQGIFAAAGILAWSVNIPLLVQLADWAEQHGVELEFIQPGKPTQNSYVERFNRTFRDEILNFYVFSRLSEVRSIVDDWIKEYNEQRPHESLGNLTPEEFALKHVEVSSLEMHSPN